MPKSLGKEPLCFVFPGPVRWGGQGLGMSPTGKSGDLKTKVKLWHSHHPSYESGLKAALTKAWAVTTAGATSGLSSCAQTSCPAPGQPLAAAAAGNAPFPTHPVDQTPVLHRSITTVIFPSPAAGWVTRQGTPPALLGTPAEVSQDFAALGVARGHGGPRDFALDPMATERAWEGGVAGVAAAHEQLGFCLQSPWATGNGTHLGEEGAWEVSMGWPIHQKALNGE